MKTVIFCFSLFPAFLLAQIQFESGYLILNNSKRTDCFIKNIEWRNNPDKLLYKLSEEGEVNTTTIDDIQEFGIGTHTKYQRATVNIDRSPDQIRIASISRLPEWSEETVLLQVLTEGPISLYVYNSSMIQRFFYQKEGEEIKPLISKLFQPQGEGDVRWNHAFRQELFQHLNCTQQDMNYFSNFAYTEKALLRHIQQENACLGSSGKIYEKGKRDAFNLKIAPGIKIGTLDFLYSSSSWRNLSFESQISQRIGIEFEYIMPFHKNRWGIFVEPTYQTYQNQTTWNNGVVEASYQSIEIPVGLRHYFFVHKQVALFLDFVYVMEHEINDSHVSYKDNPSLNFGFNPESSFEFGAGAKLFGKFTLEARYLHEKDAGAFLGANLPYRSITVILGYTIL